MESANTTQKINRRNRDGSCSNYTARDNAGVVMDISNYVHITNGINRNEGQWPLYVTN